MMTYYRLQLVVKALDTYPNEPTTQNSIKVSPKLLKYENGNVTLWELVQCPMPNVSSLPDKNDNTH